MAPSTAPSGVERPKSFAPRQPSDGAAGASGRLGSVIETRQCCFGMVRARRERKNLANEGVHSKSATPLPAGSASRLVAPGYFQLALHTLDEPSGPISFDQSSELSVIAVDEADPVDENVVDQPTSLFLGEPVLDLLVVL